MTQLESILQQALALKPEDRHTSHEPNYWLEE
jgi:hypothetical protein